MRKKFIFTLLKLFIFTCALFPQNFQPTPNDTLTSFIIHQDNGITFRMYAPQAKEVSLGGTDIPNLFQTGKMTKRDDDVWEITIAAIEPGAYRYNFNVDGVSVIDPHFRSFYLNDKSQYVEQMFCYGRILELRGENIFFIFFLNWI